MRPLFGAALSQAPIGSLLGARPALELWPMKATTRGWIWREGRSAEAAPLLLQLVRPIGSRQHFSEVQIVVCRQVVDSLCDPRGEFARRSLTKRIVRGNAGFEGTSHQVSNNGFENNTGKNFGPPR